MLMIRFNLRLIKISQYFQKFELDIRYKPEKYNVILDIFSRFISINKNIFQFYYIKFDILQNYAYTITLIKINKDFKTRIIKDYELNSL